MLFLPLTLLPSMFSFSISFTEKSEKTRIQLLSLIQTALCAPMLARVLEEQGKVTLFLCQAEMEHHRLAPLKLCPPP